MSQRKRPWWKRSNLAGDVIIHWNYKMYYKDANNNPHSIYYGNSARNKKSRVSATIFSYKWGNTNIQVDLSRSWCKVTHQGAGAPDILINNVFTTH